VYDLIWKLNAADGPSWWPNTHHTGLSRNLALLSAAHRRTKAFCDIATTKRVHSTVTDLARLRGWSTSVPITTAV
jgi:hypothetical protein